jgi:type II secretory ATPase GspE/PulE/Tfp pilus assembly ATPase PilB-like protein
VLYRGKGCAACGSTGYSGRLPIFEFLVVDEEISERIVTNQSEAEIRATSRRKGFGGILESGAKAALAGKTTAEEVFRVASTADK